MVEQPRRGEIYWAALDPVVGREMGKTRPVVIVQNDVGNEHSPTTVVAPLTSHLPSRPYPFVVMLPAGTLPKPSIADCAHVRAIDKQRLVPGVSAILDGDTMAQVDEALKASLGLR